LAFQPKAETPQGNLQIAVLFVSYADKVRMWSFASFLNRIAYRANQLANLRPFMSVLGVSSLKICG